MAKELELKYGCNPNQNRHASSCKKGNCLSKYWTDVRIHQFSGRFQQLATGQRIERSYRTTRSNLLQACQSGRSRSRNRVEWHLEENLFCEWLATYPIGYRICPCSWRWPHVFLRRLYRIERYLRRSYRAPHQPWSFRRRHSSRLHTGSAGNPENKRKGTYNVIKIDPAYRPAPIEHKDVFGITFEQGRNEIRLDESLLTHIPTKASIFQTKQNAIWLLPLSP